MNLLNKMSRRTDPKVYLDKDASFKKTLGTKEFLTLGTGVVVSTAIFTLPGIVAAENTGPSIVIAITIAAAIAGLAALAFGEMASALPVAGSAYSWTNILHGEFFGWIAGWGQLAEYIIAPAFIASGLSANLRGLLTPFGIQIPKQLANPFGVKGGLFDIIAIIALFIVAVLISRGSDKTAKIDNYLVIVKVLAVLAFVAIGLSAIHPGNYIPFVPKHAIINGTSFGGWQGILAGSSAILLAFLGFDSIAASAPEAKKPGKTIPRGILGSLIIAVILYVSVSLVLIGMYKYTNFANNAEPIGWALRTAGHSIAANIIQFLAVLGMLTALIGSALAGSRILYSFGRDKMLPKWLGHLNQHHLPNRALWTMSIASMIIGAILPLSFLSQLISAATLVAYVIVVVSLFRLRKLEKQNKIQNNGFHFPGYPYLPIITIIGLIIVFLSLNNIAKFSAALWFIVGIIIYFAYGIRHTKR